MQQLFVYHRIIRKNSAVNIINMARSRHIISSVQNLEMILKQDMHLLMVK